MPPKFESFSAFFPYYLAEHAHPKCRVLHYIGTTLASSILLFAVMSRNWWMIVLYPLIGYGFAWAGHFVFERNKPATFQYPGWSFLGDYKMLWLALTGKLSSALAEADRKYGAGDRA